MNHQKNGENWKYTQQSENMCKNSKFCNFRAISTYKRKHFSHRIQFQTENAWFVWRKIEKIKFFRFFVKINADHFSSAACYLDLGQKKFKTELL